MFHWRDIMQSLIYKIAASRGATKIMQVKQLKFLFLLIFCFSHSVLAEADFPSIPPTSTPPLSTAIPKAPALSVKSFILIDFLSDQIIAEQGVDERAEPASLTKMMTIYVADQALKHNKIKLNDKVKISEKAWRASGSRMFLQVNTEVAVEDLLKGIIIQSGNDASIALAEHIAGDESAFAQFMNYYAAELGMTNTHFENATGLPDPNHYTTAKDMATLGKALIRDFPESYALYSQKEYVYQNIKQTNRNRLLWKHDWVDGIKTGHTESAGFCLVASGIQDGMRLIAVIMGAKNDGIRTDETNQLLTYGFRFYETRKLYPKALRLAETRVWMGKTNEIGLGLAEDLYVTLGRGLHDRLKSNISVNKTIKAPILEGAVLGTLTVQLDDQTLLEKPIVALQAVPEANIFSRAYDYIVLSVKSLWNRD